MCQPRRTPGHRNMANCSPCECGCMPPFRRYYSSGEERERLEGYREQLKKELEGVEERINGLEV